MARAVFVTVVFLVFTAYSLDVTYQHGFLAAFTLPLQGGWSGQEFLDLCIALFVASTWMRRDAREKKLPFWPFALGCLPLGSVSLLAYATLSAWTAVARRKKIALTTISERSNLGAG